MVLSLQLPFALVPLLLLTGDRKLMGAFATSVVLRGMLWVVAAVLIVLNVVMLGQAGGLIPAVDVRSSRGQREGRVATAKRSCIVGHERIGRGDRAHASQIP